MQTFGVVNLKPAIQQDIQDWDGISFNWIQKKCAYARYSKFHVFNLSCLIAKGIQWVFFIQTFAKWIACSQHLFAQLS